MTPGISTSDTELATDSIGVLLGETESSRQFEKVAAPSIPGTYWVGACIDTVNLESDISNNCSTSVEIVVSGVDLVVQFPSVDDSTLTPGQNFTASATVRNQGNQTSPSTTLRYYRSTTSTISTSDTEIGTDSIDSLSEDVISKQSSLAIAPSATGIYWIGACVDGVSGETNTDNNCSTSVEIIVDTPRIGDEGVLCFPIKTQNAKIAVICL